MGIYCQGAHYGAILTSLILLDHDRALATKCLQWQQQRPLARVRLLHFRPHRAYTDWTGTFNACSTRKRGVSYVGLV